MAKKSNVDEYMAAQQYLNDMNYESASRQMQFQEYMSSTAHQRETKDLLAAGLNPVLSANNGAASLPGAYAGIDSSPLTAKMQEKQLKLNLANQAAMNKYSTDMSYRLGVAQANIGAAATRAAAAMSAGAAMYGADQARASALDVAVQSGTNQLKLANYNYYHPTTAEGAAVVGGTQVANKVLTASRNNGGSGRGYNVFRYNE